MNDVSLEPPPPSKLLVAEDDPLIRETLQDLLVMAGFDPTVAANGKEALAAYDGGEFDAVLSDIRMPEMDGFQLLRHIRARSPWVPMIFLSAKAASNDIRMGMELGADDYLTKPYDIGQLKKSIQRRIERSQAMSAQMKQRANFLRRYLPHEMRTPMTGIIGFADILQLELEDEDLDVEALKSYADGIMKSAERMMELVEDFTLWADLSTSEATESGKFFSEEDHDFVERITPKLEACAARYVREDDLRACLGTVRLRLHEGVLHRVVTNVFENACKFSLPATPIILVGNQSEDAYELSIQNSSSAPTVEFLSRPDFFYQPNRQTQEQQGLGLGLALARLYLSQIGGHLEIVQNAAESNFKITLTLPLGLKGSNA